MSKFMDIIMLQLGKDDNHAQVLVKECLRRHGDKVLTALLKEFGHLHKYDTFDPQIMDNLSFEERKEALNIFTMVKEKRDEITQARACAYGRKQKRYIPTEEVTSPTIQLEILIISLIIDAKEGGDIAIADVFGEYLKAIIMNYVLVKFTGKTIDIMCTKVSSEYKKIV